MKTPKPPKPARPVFAPPAAPAATPAVRADTLGSGTGGGTEFAPVGAETLITSMGRKPEVRSQRRTLLGG